MRMAEFKKSQLTNAEAKDNDQQIVVVADADEEDDTLPF